MKSEMALTFTKLAISDVVLIKPQVFLDDRGYFFEVYKSSEFQKQGINVNFVQENHSFSKAGVIRGLHFQRNPSAQGKLVRIVQGKVFDVAVDIRQGSPTYGKWVSATLSAENQLMLWVPPGFAHGVCALEDSHFLYKVSSAEYSAKDDCSILWNDPAIQIKWPIENPNLSDKDRVGKRLEDIESNFLLSTQPDIQT